MNADLQAAASRTRVYLNSLELSFREDFTTVLLQSVMSSPTSTRRASIGALMRLKLSVTAVSFAIKACCSSWQASVPLAVR